MTRAPLRDRCSWTSALGLALLVFVAGRCLVPMDETDLFYNLRLGEIILGTHRIPRTNLLSFTNPDYPDPNLAWVFQILSALAHRAGGIPGTVVLKTAFVVATFALLFRVALRRGAHPALAAATLALSAWAAEPRFVERPHLVTFLGLATLLLALERAEARRPRLLVALLPLGLVWANGNSCFFFAPAILALYAAGAWLDGASAPGVRRAGLVAVGLVPLLFATPSGAGFLGYVANHFRMPSLRPLQEYRVAEWPLDGPFFFLAAAVLLVSLRMAVDRRREPGARAFRQLLPVVALGLLGARRIRFVAEFALLAGPYVAAGATRLLTATPLAQPRATRAASALVLATLGVLTVGPRVRTARAGEPVFDLGLEEGLVPVAAIRWIDGHGLRARLYNDLEVGSFLAWDGWPRARVFQDPRINGYPPAWHALLRRRDLTRADWEALLGRFEVTAALISYPAVNPRAALFDPARWALVYRAEDALVFARRDPAVARLIEANELPWSFRFDAAGDGGVEPLPLVERPAASPVPDCEWQRRLAEGLLAARNPRAAEQALRRALADPTCLPPARRDDTRAQAGALALERREPARAADLLAGLAVPGARTNRGFALIELHRFEEALAELSGALREAPDDPQAHFGRGLALARLGRPAEAATELRAFVARWPTHFAVPEAGKLLDSLPR